MEAINLILDIVLIAASIQMMFVLRQLELGGAVGRTLQLVTVGALVLGVSHLLESAMFQVVDDTEFVEFIHRLTIFLGFALLIIGFRQLAASVKA